MPTIIPYGALSLYDVIQFTYRSEVVRSRFYNMDRDVIRTRVIIKKINKLSVDHLNQPTVKYEIFSSSYPQYKPYNLHKLREAKRKVTEVHKQRKYKHTYSFVLELEELKISSFYRTRTGSQLKWVDRPPQRDIKTIYKDTREKIIKRHTDRKTKKIDKAEVKKDIEILKKHAKYLDVGDWNSQVKGIMGDFYYREAPLLRKYGMLYGKCWYTDLPTGINLPFMNKHELSIIFYLLKTKKIENDSKVTIR